MNIKIILKYIISLEILLWTSVAVFSQSCPFRSISVAEGLQDLIVNALYKDSLGYVWIGTASSLERFDGVHLKSFPIPGENGKRKDVNVIVEMPGHELWMGNRTGLWKVDGEKLLQVATDTIRSGVYSLCSDGKGTLYIGSESGLFIYNSKGMERILLDPNILSGANFIMGMVLDDQDTLWAVTRKGLYSVILSDKSVLSYPCLIDGQEYENEYNNIYNQGSILYLGTTERGIIAFDKYTHRFTHWMDLGHVTSLSGNGKDMLYVGTNGNGAYFVSTNEKRIIRSFRHEPGNEKSLRSNSVYSMLVDRDGLVWIGLFQFGLDYTMYQSGIFSTYSFPPFFDSEGLTVRTIELRDGEKLIGSRDGLFYLDEKRGLFRSFRSPELRSNMIMCTYTFHDHYYIGTYGGGMYVLDPLTMKLRDFDVREPSPFIKGRIFGINADYDDNLWIATSKGLYCYKDGKQIRHYTNTNSKLPEGNIYGVYFDSTRRGWVYTESGLYIIESGSDRLITDRFPKDFIHDKLIRAVYEDSFHRLHFLPDKGAIYSSDLYLKQCRDLSSVEVLKGRNAMFMIEDKEGWYWVGTNNGLYRYKGDKIEEYNFADGVSSPIFLTCIPKIDKTGTIWIGNSNGLLFTNSDRIIKGRKYPYPLSITGVYDEMDNVIPVIRENAVKYNVDLKSRPKSLMIHFSAFTYTDPAYMSYEYQLEGDDTGWIKLAGKSEVVYYGLSSGNYVFNVRRIGDPASEISLVIHIPFVMNRWLWVLLGGIIILGTIVLLSSKLKKKSIKDTEDVESPATMKYKSCHISAEECRELLDKLESIMNAEKLYINPNLKISDLSDRLEAPVYILSYFFNQYLNCSYYDYINNCRISEFKKMVEAGEHNRYTLDTLIERCGFNSRATFFRNFKKVSGITPNEYIRKGEKTV
ncbi:two-component regulator propeller domain-containing protein [Phocaeicola sartorii]|uniref:two-component regulator propeller domain-containing protein n=1 Tax=Phocaeicola sartorii TaxID=671267 RepID=UPI0035124139